LVALSRRWLRRTPSTPASRILVSPRLGRYVAGRHVIESQTTRMTHPVRLAK
jgi:hypothetical protein